MSGDIVIPSQKTSNTPTSPCCHSSSDNVAFEYRQDDEGDDNHNIQWLCNYCQVVRFKTFENAVAHEEKCSQRGKNHRHRSILFSPSRDDASTSSLPSSSQQQQQQRRRHSYQLTSNSIVKKGKKGWRMVSTKVLSNRMKSMKSVFKTKKKGRRNSAGSGVDDSSSVSTFGTAASNKSHRYDKLFQQSSSSVCRSTELTIACSSDVTGGGSYDNDDDYDNGGGEYSEFLRQLDDSFHLSLHATVDDFMRHDKTYDHSYHSAHCQKTLTIEEIENDNSRHDDDGNGVSPSLSPMTTPSNPQAFHHRSPRQKQRQHNGAHNDGLAPRSSPLDVSERLRRITLTATPQDVQELAAASCSFLPIPATTTIPTITGGDGVESDGLMSYYSHMGGCLLPDYYGSYVNSCLDYFRVAVGLDG